MAIAVHAQTPHTVAGVTTTLVLVATSRLAAEGALRAQGLRVSDYRYVQLKPAEPDRSR
jgi:hypothetical protein